MWIKKREYECLRDRIRSVEDRLNGRWTGCNSRYIPSEFAKSDALKEKADKSDCELSFYTLDSSLELSILGADLLEKYKKSISVKQAIDMIADHLGMTFEYQEKSGDKIIFTKKPGPKQARKK